MSSLRLYKKEKLRSRTALGNLFGGSRGDRRASSGPGPDGGSLAYPWRAVWRINTERSHEGAKAQFAIMVPKRRLRHAVDRVTMRRRMREAYRLNRHLLPPEAACLDIVFIYVAPQLTSYRNTHGSLVKLLGRVAESLVSASENR